MQSSKQGMWKGHHLSLIEGIQKGYLFREKKKKNNNNNNNNKTFIMRKFHKMFKCA